jgi:hypothetical protein
MGTRSRRIANNWLQADKPRLSQTMKDVQNPSGAWYFMRLFFGAAFNIPSRSSDFVPCMKTHFYAFIEIELSMCLSYDGISPIKGSDDVKTANGLSSCFTDQRSVPCEVPFSTNESRHCWLF